MLQIADGKITIEFFGTLAVIHFAKPVEDAELQSYFDVLTREATKLKMQASIILSEHPPTPKQRTLMAERVKASPLLAESTAALITDSVIARGAMTALGWLSKDAQRTRAFSPREVDAALEWLAGIAAFDRAAVRAYLSQRSAKVA